MKNEDVKRGMKVVPHSKTVSNFGHDVEKSVAWRKAQANNQPFLYVVDKTSNVWILNDKYSENMVIDGDFFNAKDFEPYQEV
jgi:hypothetical protein